MVHEHKFHRFTGHVSVLGKKSRNLGDYLQYKMEMFHHLSDSHFVR